MTESNLTGPINPYGDLSRRARRELEAKGIDPDAALAQYHETGNIEALTGTIPVVNVPVAEPVAAPVVEDIVEAQVSEAVDEKAESAESNAAEPELIEQPAVASVFPSSMSRRDENILEQRMTAETEIVVPEVSSVPETPEDMDELIAIVERDTNVVPDPALSSSQDVAPVVFDGGPLADVEDVIAIDRSEDSEATISEYEAFQITTTSTGVIPTTGHTLILPTLPEEDPVVIASLNETGEIVITGQITLPAAPATGGNSTALDSSDLDSVIEPELVTSSQDLAPVSAAAAVSSSAGPATAVAPVRRRSEKLPLILAISAAVLAVGVVALFVANLFIPVFK